MKKKFTYAAIIIIVLLILGLVSLKLFSKDKNKEENEKPKYSEPTSSRVGDAVAFDIRMNHASLIEGEFVEDWTFLTNTLTIQEGDTISSYLYKNSEEDTFIKDIHLKEDGVSFSLKDKKLWKEISLAYDEEYKYLSADYQYTIVSIHKLKITGYELLPSDIFIEKKYYEDYNSLSEEQDNKIGDYTINTLEELKDIANSKLVETYKDYDFTKNSLYVIKSYGNKENNCYKRDQNITMSLTNNNKIYLVQDNVKEAETNCMAILTDIKYRVFEVKGKYEEIIIDSINNYIEK